MNKINNSENYQLIDDLFSLFAHDKFKPEDEELFKEWNIDIDKIVDENLALFKQLNTKTKAELNQIKHERVLNFLSKLKKDLASDAKNSMLIAEEILSNNKLKELQPMFRNLDTLSDKDKKSILFDTKVLDILSEFEKKYNSDLKK
ncbi:MAG: hypothetical protein ACFFAT_21040 [Promethearchaeota archaeon]